MLTIISYIYNFSCTFNIDEFVPLSFRVFPSKMPNSWFKTRRRKKALKLAGLTASAASATISLVLSATPLLPVAVVTGVLGLLGGSVIPGAELALDWKYGGQEAMGNGLHI